MAPSMANTESCNILNFNLTTRRQVPTGRNQDIFGGEIRLIFSNLSSKAKYKQDDIYIQMSVVCNMYSWTNKDVPRKSQRCALALAKFASPEKLLARNFRSFPIKTWMVNELRHSKPRDTDPIFDWLKF
jgi:hypothetical protein